MAGLIIMHDWQQVGKAGWFGAQPLGGVDNAVLFAVGRNGDKRIEVFFTSDGTVVFITFGNRRPTADGRHLNSLVEPRQIKQRWQ